MSVGVACGAVVGVAVALVGAGLVLAWRRTELQTGLHVLLGVRLGGGARALGRSDMQMAGGWWEGQGTA